MMRFTMMIIAILGLSVFAFTIGNEFILTHNVPKVLKSIVYLLHPPKDLYATLLKEAVVSGKCSGSFILKYHGKYAVEFIPSDIGEKNVHFDRLKCKGDFIITMSDNGTPVLHKTINGEDISGWSSRTESGFTVLDFEVPSQIPAGKQINLHVMIEPRGDRLLQAGSILVSKRSDL